jgi:hypothetical protein
MLPRKVRKIPAQEPQLEPEDSGEANAEEPASVHQQKRAGQPVLTCIIMGK